VESQVSGRFFDLATVIALATGCLLVAVYIKEFLVSLVRTTVKDVPRWLRAMVLTSNTKGEYRLKQAAARKINIMLMNAAILHAPSLPSDLEVKESKSTRDPVAGADQTMLNFVLRGRKYELAGGFFWTLKLVLSGEYFDTLGCWIPTRMLIFQVAQIIFAAFIGYAAFALTGYIADQAAEAQKNLNPDWPKWVLQYVYDGCV